MNVEDLLISKDITFKLQGGDYVVSCLNPEHPDKNPSMRIDRITGIFNCFSCKFKGNIFTYYEVEGVGRLIILRETLKKRIQEKVAESKGLRLPSNYIKYIGSWRDISSETYEKFEAFQSSFSEYVGRIVFPVKDLSGKIIAFIGRDTSINIPKYLVVPHKAKIPFYPSVKPIKGSIILVEGIFDMLNLYDKGMRNVICAFGTQTISEAKLNLLKIKGVESVIIFLDGDDAGQEAAIKVKSLCEKVGLSSKNIYLKGKDPGDLTQEQVNTLNRKLYS